MPTGAAQESGPTAETSPWSRATQSASLVRDGGLVTVVEGSSFCLSGRSGDILADYPHGLFVLDTRALSRWELSVNGSSLEPLTVAVDAPYEATFVGRPSPSRHQADSDLLVFRQRHVGNGMREKLRIHNFSPRSLPAIVEIRLDVDFADVFEVKESRVVRRGEHRVDRGATRWVFERRHEGLAKRVEIRLSQPAAAEPGMLTWQLHLPARGHVDLCVGVEITVGDRHVEPRFRCGEPDEHTEPVARRRAWHRGAPLVEADDASIQQAVQQAIDDLGALRIFDPEHPELPVIAAGAPWFMTLFGRDSLLASWMALLVDPSLALSVLETLARFQGTATDDRTEEQPGRILHEIRFGSSSSLALGGGSVYYGTADATPLFVMLAGEVARWGHGPAVLSRLLPAVDAALRWIEEVGDRDGDGYVEYQRPNAIGLVNQGWKDSWDGINFADGRLAQAPLALCEVQGYVYAAYLARAQLALAAGDAATAQRCEAKAASLRHNFNRDFWLDDRGWFAAALDAEKRPVDALMSNMGHCLWTGIVEPDHAARVAELLVSPAMFTGWGVRTLGATMARYNPVSYHNGSVWPHDTAICAAGLMRYGHVDEANRLIDGLLDAAAALGGRLPELFAGLDRTELSVPAAYPTSCSPQAWAAAAPLLMVRTLLRLDPGADGTVHLAPVPPARLGRLLVHGIRVGDRSLDVTCDAEGVRVDGLDGLRLHRTPRPLP